MANTLIKIEGNAKFQGRTKFVVSEEQGGGGEEQGALQFNGQNLQYNGETLTFNP